MRIISRFPASKVRNGTDTGSAPEGQFIEKVSPMQALNYGEEKWRALARQALEEQDHEKMLMLVQQIIDAYREQRPTSHRTVQLSVKDQADKLVQQSALED
jgi:hypothetical protein